MSGGHWVDWHKSYGDPGSYLSRRLRVVQQRLREALDSAPPGRLQLISACAGQGRDVIGVLEDHPRRAGVSARLVELDPALADAARHAAGAAGLDNVEVVTGDASTTSTYRGAVPADVVLLCGIFGNVGDDDIRRTIEELTHLCAASATVIWTRHRRKPDLTPSIRSWFEAAGFAEVAFDAPADVLFSVGTNRLATPPEAFRPDVKMFDFTGDGSAGHR